MLGLLFVVLVYGVLCAAIIPIARIRSAKANLDEVYKNPLAVRAAWKWHAPGVWVLVAAWYIAPSIMMFGMLLETRIPLLIHPSKAKLIESVGTTAAVQFDSEKRKVLADLDKRAAHAKQNTGWLAQPPEEIERQRQAAATEINEKYSDANREKYIESQKQVEYDRQFPHPAEGPRDVSHIILDYFQKFWGITWLALMWWLWRSWRRNRTRGGFQGFARWSKWNEVIFSPTYRFLIPLWISYASTTRDWYLWERYVGNVGLAVFAPPEGDAVCTHYLLLGATGSGKGAAIFSHIMATSRGGCIYQDIKAECPMIDTPKWRNAIRWGCAAEGGWPSMSWNPIIECRNDPDPENAFLNLATVLIPDAEGENAWIPKLARPVVAEMLMSGRWNSIADFADELKGRPFKDICESVNMPAGLQAGLQGRNVSEYLFTSAWAETTVFKGWARDVTTAHDFSLDDLIARGGYILAAETEESRRAPIKLMWAMLLRKLMRSSERRNLTLLMDECKVAGKLPHFADALVTLRNRGVSIWSAWQSESQIISVYGREEGEAILDAFGNRVSLLHGINVRDAEALSKASGNWSKKRGGHMSFGMSMSGPSLTGTTGGSDENPIPLITATDILNRSRCLEDRWAIISARGGTTKGNLIIARMMPGHEWARPPKPDEIANEWARIVAGRRKSQLAADAAKAADKVT